MNTNHDSLLPFPDFPDIHRMSESELRAMLERIDRIYDDLQLREPEDESSDEYEAWEESLEDLDDMIDDIQDLLDHMS